MFGSRRLAGEEYSLVVGEVHPQELLLLQRLHQRRLRGTHGQVQCWPALTLEITRPKSKFYFDDICRAIHFAQF